MARYWNYIPLPDVEGQGRRIYWWRCSQVVEKLETMVRLFIFLRLTICWATIRRNEVWKKLIISYIFFVCFFFSQYFLRCFFFLHEKEPYRIIGGKCLNLPRLRMCYIVATAVHAAIQSCRRPINFVTPPRSIISFIITLSERVGVTLWPADILYTHLYLPWF